MKNKMKQNKQTEKKKSSLGARIAKYVTALAVVLVLFWFGCTCEVREGETAVILRFGAVREEITEAGLYFKLPWPFESSVTYDGRLQFCESNKIETMTKDKRNIVVESWVAWEIADPVLYHNSVGSSGSAEAKINSQVFNATNSTLGTYNLTNLVSLQREEIKIDQIQEEIFEAVQYNCLKNYGIAVRDVSIMSLSMPDATLKSVFEQMKKDRQKEIDEIINAAYLEATQKTNAADITASGIKREGQEIASGILSEAEAAVMKIYNDAYLANNGLYNFLREMDTLIATINSQSVMIININEYPFNVLLKYSDHLTEEEEEEVVISDLTHILARLKEDDPTAYQDLIDDLGELIAAAKQLETEQGGGA